MQAVSVIVPTLARGARADRIHRALASIRAQAGVRAVPIVVINGAERDPVLAEGLLRDPGLRTIAVDSFGIPAAFAAGRALVDTEFFTALDDDDLLLPEALAGRLEVLRERRDLEAVVSNGIRRDARGDVVHVTAPDQLRQRPLDALLEGNWLLPGSWLARSDALPLEFFRAMPRYLECTYLAVRLASAGRMAFLAEPTVVWHTDDPESESKSPEFAFGEIPALRRILALDLPRHFRRGIRRKISEAAHGLASRCSTGGRRAEAWRWHWMSLTQPGGWRYLMYTRRLLRPRRAVTA